MTAFLTASIHAGEALPAKVPDPAPQAKIDARGFIDVWQLRTDVAVVEALQASDDTDRCYQEGDGDGDAPPPTAAQILRDQKAEARCLAKVKRDYEVYRQAFAKFNAIWLPAVREAMAKGDPVAEVIARLCDTTPALDRTNMESTCSEAPARRAIALQKLAATKFRPAFLLASRQDNPVYHNDRLPHEPRQKAVIQEMEEGLLDIDGSYRGIDGNVVTERDSLDDRIRSVVIAEVDREAPRKWSVGLSINLKPTTSSYLTWGRAAHYGGGNGIYTGPMWRSSVQKVWVSRGPNGEKAISGRGVQPFEQMLRKLLASTEANIERYLKADPRWGVFLLQRIGHHEWVPQQATSRSQLIDASWLGTWTLEKWSDDWSTPMQSPPLQAILSSTGELTSLAKPTSSYAVISRNGELTQITLRAQRTTETLPNVSDCTLRYSGASTYLPELGPEGQKSTATLLGYFYRNGGAPSGGFYDDCANRDAVAPFDPKKRYKQVLMQCQGAESAESDRVRFLLLAGDVLVEFGASAPYGKPLAVRHYRRQ